MRSATNTAPVLFLLICIFLSSLDLEVGPNLDDEVDLNAGPKRQRSHPDRRTRRKGLTEILCVDPIHRNEVAHAREIHAGAHNVIETPAGRFEALAIASDGSGVVPITGWYQESLGERLEHTVRSAAWHRGRAQPLQCANPRSSRPRSRLRN